jgi:hypothetical protein
MAALLYILSPGCLSQVPIPGSDPESHPRIAQLEGKPNQTLL